MDPELALLIEERHRAAAYGMMQLVKIADAEIGRRMVYGNDSKPVERHAPERQTAEAPTDEPAKRGPGRPRKATA